VFVTRNQTFVFRSASSVLLPPFSSPRGSCSVGHFIPPPFFYFPFLSGREGGFTSPHSSPGCVGGSSGVGGFLSSSLSLDGDDDSTTWVSLYSLVGVGLPYCITSSSFESPERRRRRLERESYIEGGGGE